MAFEKWTEPVWCRNVYSSTISITQVVLLASLRNRVAPDRSCFVVIE